MKTSAKIGDWITPESAPELPLEILMAMATWIWSLTVSMSPSVFMKTKWMGAIRFSFNSSGVPAMLKALVRESMSR